MSNLGICLNLIWIWRVCHQRIFVEIIFQFGSDVDYYFDLPKKKKKVSWRRCIPYFMWRFFLRCTYLPPHTTFTAKKNDFLRTEPGVWGARVTVVYFRFQDNFERFYHTSIITNFDVFNLVPTLFVSSRVLQIHPRSELCSDFACDAYANTQ